MNGCEAAPPSRIRTAVWVAGVVALVALVICGCLLVPTLQTRWVVSDFDLHRAPDEPADETNQALVKRLGGSESAAARLKAYLASSRWLAPKKASAIMLLAACGRHGVRPLEELLQSDDEGVRLRALRALSRMGSEARSATPALVKALNDREEKIRQGAASLLGLIGAREQSTVSALARALGDPDALVRAYAAGALGRIGDDAQSASRALTLALSDSDYRVRASAAHSLGQIGGPHEGTIAKLRQLLGDSKLIVRIWAAWSLCRLDNTPEDAIGVLRVLGTSKDVYLRKQAIGCLCLLAPTGAKAVLEVLEKARDDSDLEIRQMVASALADAYLRAEPEEYNE